MLFRSERDMLQVERCGRRQAEWTRAGLTSPRRGDGRPRRADLVRQGEPVSTRPRALSRPRTRPAGRQSRRCGGSSSPRTALRHRELRLSSASAQADSRITSWTSTKSSRTCSTRTSSSWCSPPCSSCASTSGSPTRRSRRPACSASRDCSTSSPRSAGPRRSVRSHPEPARGGS